jgi:two-component system, LytTR family, response regulator
MKQFLMIKAYTQWRYVSTDSIVQIEGASNYSRLYFDDGTTLIIAKTLKMLSASLPDHFLRIHKSCLLNSNFIVEITDSKTIILSNGVVVKLARRKATSFRHYFVGRVTELVA